MRRTKNKIDPHMRQLQSRIDDLIKKGHEEFVRVTPIRTGNAKRSTALSGKEIQANYNYAVKLEKESWSRQAPQGMSEPTINFLKKRVRDLLG